MIPVCANCGKAMPEAGFCCQKCHDEYFDNLNGWKMDESEEMFNYLHR